MLLRLNRLPENRVAAAILLFHSPGCIIEVIKRFRLDRSHMRDNRACIRIHLQNRATARTSQIKVALLSHLREMIPQNSLSRVQPDGKDMKKKEEFPPNDRDNRNRNSQHFT